MHATAWKIIKTCYPRSGNFSLVKSDRINALRKQYDSFLEDDKKRKERNEYILEKLDKMRYCTAMVQVRQKPPVLIDRKVSLYNMPEEAVNSNTSIHLDPPRNRIDETMLLQEISKKFILIPKLKSYDNNCTNQIKPKVDANTDWKSKYEILNQLKRDEKGQDSFSPQEGLDELEDAMGYTYLKENEIPQDDEPVLQYATEPPVKLLPDNQKTYELQHNASNNAGTDPTYLYDNQLNDTAESLKVNNTETELYGKENDYNNIHNTVNDQNVDLEKIYSDTTPIYDQMPIEDNLEYLNTDEVLENHKYDSNVQDIPESMQLDTKTNIAVENSIELHPQLNNNIEQEYTAISDSFISNDQLAHKEENNNVVDVDYQVNPNQEEVDLQHEDVAGDGIYETGKDLPTEHSAPQVAPNIDYPTEAEQAQDFTSHDNLQLMDGKDEHSSGTLDRNNDAAQDTVQTENVNTTDETLNAEQSDGFYTQQTEGYNYTPEGVENYDTQYSAPTENINAEYSAPENYQQNAEYNYYEGQPEQNYAEINEHEETSQQYDQNYEQQYGNTYDEQAYQQEGYGQEYAQNYEDQQEYTDPQQQFETLDQVQQDLQYQDNPTPQYVEQQLDHEEGYVETTNGKTEEHNVENVMELQQNPTVIESNTTVQ